jgi:hypothetical protein
MSDIMTPPDPSSSPSPDSQNAKAPETSSPVQEIRVEHRVAYDDQVKPEPRDLPVIKREVEPKLPEIESAGSKFPQIKPIPIPPKRINQEQAMAAAIAAHQAAKPPSALKVVFITLGFLIFIPCVLLFFLASTCNSPNGIVR